MDCNIGSGPPCLEKETGAAVADSNQHRNGSITDDRQLPPPLTLEGSREGSHKKLGIFARVYPTKRGAITDCPTRHSERPRMGGHSPRGRQWSSSRSLFPRGSSGTQDINVGAERGGNRDSPPTKFRGRLFASEDKVTLLDRNSSPRRSIGKAPPVGIFGVNRSPPTLLNNRMLVSSPKTIGRSWMDRCGPLGYATRPSTESALRTHAGSSLGQDVCIVSRVSPPDVLDEVPGKSLESRSRVRPQVENIQNGETESDLGDSSSDAEEIEIQIPSGSPSPSRASPRRAGHVASPGIRSLSPTGKPLQNLGVAPKRGTSRGRRSYRGRLGTRGRGRGRGMMTRLRDPTRDLLVEGKRNSPLRRKTETIGLGRKPRRGAPFGSMSGKLESTSFQDASSGLTFTGRGFSRGRGRGTTRSRGTRYRGRGRGRGVRTRGGLGRGQSQGLETAKKSLAPYLGLTSFGQTKGYFGGFSPSTLDGVRQDNLDMFGNPLAAGVGLDKNANVTSFFPFGGVKILSIEDVTTGSRGQAESPEGATVKGHRTGSPRAFTEGEDVLARWTDGLVYLGTIQKVEEEKEKCFVTFEDSSEHWVLFKDIQKCPTEIETEDITCTVCDLGESDPPNEIVICDKCGAGFHQLCHQPFIESRYVTSEELQWLCRKCIFANAAKVGGASNKGQAARLFEQVKRSLPYKIEDLTWDKHHRTNVQKCYCYCGGPGEWYLKMLQCCRCRQWFHEACIQCLSTPMLYGDRFYLFVCSVCNSGPEYIKRLPLKWVELTQLILYNLTLNHGKKYFTLDDDILPFLNLKWNGLQVDHLATRRAEKESILYSLLHKNTTKFACGKEIRKKKDLWGLRNRTPPVPPAVLLPADGQINEEVMDSLETLEESKFMTFVPFGSNTPVPKRRLLEQQKKKKQLSREEAEKKTKRARKRLLAATSSHNPDRSSSSNQSYQGYPGTHPAPPKVRRVCKTSILDTIEPLEEVLRKQRHSVTTSTIIHHPRCTAPPREVRHSLPGDSPSETPPPGKRKRGRPKNTDSAAKDKEIGKRKLKSAKATKGDSVMTRRTSPRTRSMGGAGGDRRALLNSMTTYFGAEGRIASGERYEVLAKRKSSSGKTEYLIQWEGTTP